MNVIINVPSRLNILFILDKLMSALMLTKYMLYDGAFELVKIIKWQIIF